MNKNYIIGLFTLGIINANAQTFDEWQNPEVNAVNRTFMHTNYFAYESEETALLGHKEKSVNYMSLNGLLVLSTFGKRTLTTRAGRS